MGTVSVSLPSDGQTIDAADYNVPINAIVTEINGNLDSNNIAASGLVPNNLLTGTGTSWAWQTWTPTLTNLSGGTLTYSKYIQIGKTVFFRLKYTLAGANISGGVTFTVPVAVNSGVAGNDSESINCSVSLRDTGTTVYQGALRFSTSSTLAIYALNASATYLSVSSLSSTVPFTWANTDVIQIEGCYEVA